jgi:thioredoxin-related protein
METYREVVGHIIKEEQISLLKHQIIPDTVVLNIDHPFPGFNGWDFNLNAKPRSIIILTEKLYSWAKILRAQRYVKQNTSLDINATFAKVKIGQTEHFGIRVKGLNDYYDIPGLQAAFETYGLHLLKNKKIKTDKPVSIKISKFFHIKALEEGIYDDKCNDNMFYIEIPDYLPWESFRKVTKYVKQNVSNNNFDVAKGIFYKDDTVVDMIRLFKTNSNIDLLKEIKEQYIKAIQNI